MSVAWNWSSWWTRQKKPQKKHHKLIPYYVAKLCSFGGKLPGPEIQWCKRYDKHEVWIHDGKVSLVHFLYCFGLSHFVFCGWFSASAVDSVVMCCLFDTIWFDPSECSIVKLILSDNTISSSFFWNSANMIFVKTFTRPEFWWPKIYTKPRKCFKMQQQQKNTQSV